MTLERNKTKKLMITIALHFLFLSSIELKIIHMNRLIYTRSSRSFGRKTKHNEMIRPVDLETR